MNKIISIDPSGTGTTGIYFKNKEQEEFKEVKEKDWKKHYHFISSLEKHISLMFCFTKLVILLN